jgi:hypothetical protein
MPKIWMKLSSINNFIIKYNVELENNIIWAPCYYAL